MIRLYILLIITIPLTSLIAQSNNGALSSYEGRHFFVGFMDNEIEYSWQPLMDIYISSKYNTEVTIISHFQNDTTTFQLEKNKVAHFACNDMYEQKISEEVTEDRLVEIKSKSPISVVAKNSSVQSGDSYAIIPTRNWGTEYFAVTLPNDYYISPPGASADKIKIDFTPRLGEFLIMANEDATYVEILLTAESFNNVEKDSTIKVILNRGDSYLVKSKSVYGVKGVHDLSGTRVRSSKPVGFISGHMRTSVQQFFSYFNELETKDHLAEMLSPTNAWSNKYLTVPFGNGINSVFKVVAKDTLQLSIINDNNSNRIDMLPGETRSFTNINLPTFWEATGKFQVVQIMAKYAENEFTDAYDPAMLIVPPLDKMINKVTYYGSNDTKVSGNDIWKQYDFQSVILITEEEGKESIYVNNTNVSQILGFNEFIADGKKYFWQKVFVPPLSSVVNIHADSGKFHAIAIGNGFFDSYAMTVGASLIDEEDVEVQSPIVEINENCSSFSGTIFDEKISEFSGLNIVEVDQDVTKNMNWQISEISDTTTYATINAQVIDKNQPAFLKFSATDYFGNDTTYEFEYSGALVSMINKIDYKEVNVNKDSCYEFILTTYADSVLLSSIDLPKDLRLKLQLPFTLPKMIYKDETHHIELCLINQVENFNSIEDSLTFNFGCDYSKKIDVDATIISYNLTASNLILPKILANSNYCNSAEEYLEFKNVGNAEVIIQSAILPPSNYFTIDTTGMFPDTLKEDESIFFRDICFTSDQISDFEYIITLIDNQKINRKGSIFASTGVPKINNITHDFGATRIGSIKDTNFQFLNSGDFLSRFTLLDYNSTITNDPNVASILLIDTFNIEPNNSQSLEFTYNPIELDDFTPYELNARLIERWEPHDTITIHLTGNPTIPEIKTYNIDLDTIEIDDFRDSTVNVISSLGNEILTIKNLTLISGDLSVFEFDNSFFDSRQIDTSITEYFDIRFNGLTLGEHNMKILVESDAAPNYNSRLDTINIRGFVKERDTLDFNVSPESKNVISCNYDTLDFEITNTGNTIFRINNIRINTTIQRAEFVDKTFNAILKPDEKYSNKVLVFSSGNKTDKIYYDVEIYDITQYLDTTITASSDIISQQTEVTINPFEATNLNIGEKFDVLFSGSFPNSIDTTVNISFKLDVDISNFYLDDNKVEIVFFDANKNIVKKVNADVIPVANNYYIESNEFTDIDFENIVYWEFNARFLSLLASDLVGDIELFFNLDDCFDSNSKLTKLDVNSICIFNYRNVDLNSYITSASLTSNIISNEANLIVESTDYLPGSIYIIDYVGKKYSIFDKIMFDNGKNNIILNLSNYANGKYILVVNSLSTTITKEFIISK